MAWEWAPPAATTVASVLGVAGTFFAGERLRRAGERQAREQRVQQWRAEAYLEVLTMTERFGQWMAMTFPIFDDGSAAPELPDLPSQARSTALLRAFASDEALRLFRAWEATVRDFAKTVDQLRFAQEHSQAGLVPANLYIKLDEQHRPAELSARNSFAEWAAGELRGDSPEQLRAAQRRREIEDGKS